MERGTLEAARRIKRINSKVKVLFYLNAMVHYEGYEANVEFNKNKRRWALPGRREGQEYLLWRNRFLAYDHTNPDFREWWIQRGLDMVAHEEIDGVFIDGICKVGFGNGIRPGFTEAYLTTANELRRRLPGGKLLIGNALRAGKGKDGNLSHLKYLDGSYLEGWAGVDSLEETIELMSTALKHNRIVMLNAHPHGLDKEELKQIKSLDGRYEFLDDPRYVDFPLGFFLLTAGPNSYFSIRSGVDASAKKRCVWDNTRLDAVMRVLGEPTGDYVAEGNGVFTREFERLKVSVNIKTMEGRLAAKDGFGLGGDEL